MSVPPSDPRSPYYGPPPVNSGQLHDYGPAQPFAVPPGYGTAPNPQQGYGPTPNPQPQPSPYAPAPSKRKLPTRTVLIICLSVVLVAALVTTLVVVLGKPGLSSPSRTSVVEAIDITSQPKLGTPWNATDGDPWNDYLDADFYVTPCGMLVTVLTSDYRHQGQGAKARLVGYEISTGKKAWTVSLQQTTGLNDPLVTYDLPTYTSGCTMVLMLKDADYTVQTKVSLAVNLSTGKAALVASDEELHTCAAARARVACIYYEQLTIVDADQGTSETKPLSDDSVFYDGRGDMIVNGYVWSAGGYRDPASYDVVFGSDVSAVYGDPDQEWVVYVEPILPGSYLSGLAVRVQGPFYAKTQQSCSITVWDTDSDRAAWSQPASIPCGRDLYYDWYVAGSALIATDKSGDAMWAFSLDDGGLLWQKDIDMSLTAWYRANDSNIPLGLTQDWVAQEYGFYEQGFVRIADGALTDSPLPPGAILMTLSSTIAYADDFVGASRSLVAYSLTGNSTNPLWSLPVSSEALDLWTFVWDGTMYLVQGEYEGPTTVTPLIK